MSSEEKAGALAEVAAPPALPAPAGAAPTLSDQPPVERNELGRWVRGQSGNLKGKPKGLKNYLTRERLAMEAALRSYLSGEGQIERVFAAFDRVLQIAENGEDKEALAAAKILADKLLTAPKDATDRGPEGGQNITVTIVEARGGNEPAVTVTDAEYQEVEPE